MSNFEPCNLCGNTLYQKVAVSSDYTSQNKKKYNLYTCMICGLYQIQPVPTQEEISNFYTHDYPGNFIDESSDNKLPSKISYLINYSYRVVFKSFYRERNAIKEYRNLNQLGKLSVLDIGCGNGNFLISLKKDNFDLYGIDIDPEVIDNLKERHAIKGEVSTIFEFKSNQKFDVISMSHFLEHSTDPKRTLEIVKGLLKKDGLLLIKLPNINSITFKIFGKYCYSLDTPRHLFMFSPKTIKNFLDLSGFEVIECTTNLEKYIFPSIFNLIGLGSIRTRITGNLLYSGIYFISDLIFSTLFNIILFPFYLFSEGEEIRIKATIK